MSVNEGVADDEGLIFTNGPFALADRYTSYPNCPPYEAGAH